MSVLGSSGWALAGVAALAALALWRAGRRRALALARACHELRGSLGAVRLGVELGMRAGALPPARWPAMEQEVGRAAQALDDLQRGRRAARESFAVDVARLLRASAEAWRGAAAPRDLRLDVAEAGGVLVCGTRALLAQATGNLIANAIEHGEGAIVVRARLGSGSGSGSGSAGAGADVVWIEVTDGGPGLRVPLAELIRGRRRWWEPVPRRGHGLAIVADAARVHGGRLRSAPSERGARLVLELPVMAHPARRAAGQE